MSALPPELAAIEAALDAAEQEARAVVAGVSEARGIWRSAPGSWSVAQCLDHLATANRVYLRAMEPTAARARERRRLRRGPALPGLLGGWFVRSLEPPVRPRFKLKAPGPIKPQPSPSLDTAFASFLASQDEVRGFLRANADLDLRRVRFPNPFIRGLSWSLATGLHVIPAHERRHLWQARRVRQAAEQAGA